MGSKPTVLFICAHNASRSQIAAGYLQQLAGDRVVVLSAGPEPSKELNPVAVAAMAEEGIDITGNEPKALTADAVQAADVVVTINVKVECPYFPGKRYEDWFLADSSGPGIEALRPVREEIRSRIVTLIDSLA